jgi:glutamyl-tRNA reductase
VLSCVTADFRSAGFDLLERLTVVPAEVVARLARERADLAGAVLLATCNRFEVYLDVRDENRREPVVHALAEAVAATSGVPAATLADVLTERDGEAVAGHLFAVSSGLESLVVGEGEVAGQVSRALETARSVGSTTPDLERLFQRAARTSSTVQNRTGLGSAGRSIVRLALDLTESRVPDWSRLDVLLIGTGRYAGATLAALRDRGVEQVSVYSPSGRAARFATREGVLAVTDEAVGERIAGADLVIACTIATTPVLDAALLRRARRHPHPDRQLVLDLGLPRNIDPDVATVPGVELLDLETISLHAPLPELQAASAAQEVVDEAVSEYRAAQRATAVTPAVVAYRSHVFELVERELDRLRRRGEATEATERALRHLASVLVHTPSTRARELAATGRSDDFVQALETMFGIRVEQPAASEPSRGADSGGRIAG